MSFHFISLNVIKFENLPKIFSENQSCNILGNLILQIIAKNNPLRNVFFTNLRQVRKEKDFAKISFINLIIYLIASYTFEKILVSRQPNRHKSIVHEFYPGFLIVELE